MMGGGLILIHHISAHLLLLTDESHTHSHAHSQTHTSQRPRLEHNHTLNWSFIKLSLAYAKGLSFSLSRAIGIPRAQTRNGCKFSSVRFAGPTNGENLRYTSFIREQTSNRERYAKGKSLSSAAAAGAARAATDADRRCLDQLSVARAGVSR